MFIFGLDIKPFVTSHARRDLCCRKRIDTSNATSSLFSKCIGDVAVGTADIQDVRVAWDQLRVIADDNMRAVRAHFGIVQWVNWLIRRRTEDKLGMESDVVE